MSSTECDQSDKAGVHLTADRSLPKSLKQFSRWLVVATEELQEICRYADADCFQEYEITCIVQDALSLARQFGIAIPSQITGQDIPDNALTFLGRIQSVVKSEIPSPSFGARFLTIADAAAYIGISPASIGRMLAKGELTRLRPVKGRVVIDRLQIDSVLCSSDCRPRKGRGRGRG